MTSIELASAHTLVIADVVAFLNGLAPLDLAETWDNVGLLWGDASQKVSRVMTCLTLTPDVADEAREKSVELIVTHHPICFRPVQRINANTAEGRMLLGLARDGMAVFSAHTAYDGAPAGINTQLCQQLGLEQIAVLRPVAKQVARETSSGEMGAGRYGQLNPPPSLAALVEIVKSRLRVGSVQFVGNRDMRIDRLAIACGSGGDFLGDALVCGCDALLTGEARFHDCIEARTRGIALLLIGHFASEQPGMRRLAMQVAIKFPSLDVWASAVETDPIQHG